MHHETLGEPTEVFHSDIRERFNRGDQAVVDAMTTFADIAATGRAALIAGDTERIARLIDKNFDTRRSIYRLPPWQIDMVETARRCGASAKFAGSGGAILGTYSGEAMFDSVRDSLARIGSRTVETGDQGRAGLKACATSKSNPVWRLAMTKLSRRARTAGRRGVVASRAWSSAAQTPQRSGYVGPLTGVTSGLENRRFDPVVFARPLRRGAAPAAFPCDEPARSRGVAEGAARQNH
jgi:hypothetical protein